MYEDGRLTAGGGGDECNVQSGTETDPIHVTCEQISNICTYCILCFLFIILFLAHVTD